MTNKARTPWFPTYSRARKLYAALAGLPENAYRSLDDAIGQQMGTPQTQVKWSDPGTWIAQRLSGADQALALELWGQQINPRYTGGELALARNHKLLETDAAGLFQLTARGTAFQASDPEILREIDEEEGITQLLSVLATLGSAPRKEIVTPWMEVLTPGGDGRSQGTMESKLYDRLMNAIERNLVERTSLKYTLTPAGQSHAAAGEGRQPNTSKIALDKALSIYREEQRTRLRELLGSMHPYRFEHLIRRLLLTLGYENVEVTKQSGDGGIDVLADLRFGVTSFREAIQVKRVAGSLPPGVVNELRGSLHNAKALKGTIFTVGTFSKNAKATAAPENAIPITLVDGDELIELLIRHNIGITVTPVALVTDLDETVFSPSPPTAEEIQDLTA